MDNEEKEIVGSIMAGAGLGSIFGAMLSGKKNQDSGALMGAIIGAALLGTYKANERARKNNVPVLVEENGIIYEINAEGKKEIKKVVKPSITVPKKFHIG